MTIIILAALNNEGETAFFLKEFLKSFKGKYFLMEGDSLDTFHLRKHQHKIFSKAKNIIVFTPTYWFGIPSRLQYLIESLPCILEEETHYNFLEGKRFGCVAYSPHGGDTECITKLGLTFNGWGCEIVSCGLQYYRSTKIFHKDHWCLKDLKTLAKKFT